MRDILFASVNSVLFLLTIIFMTMESICRHKDKKDPTIMRAELSLGVPLALGGFGAICYTVSTVWHFKTPQESRVSMTYVWISIVVMCFFIVSLIMLHRYIRIDITTGELKIRWLWYYKINVKQITLIKIGFNIRVYRKHTLLFYLDERIHSFPTDFIFYIARNAKCKIIGNGE